MDLLVKPLTYASSSGSWKASDVVSDQFPAGLRVLVVDDDPTCLRILEKMLNCCLYEVTTCNRAEVALKFLRENRNGYDIVISDVHMPDMDGFKLLEHVGLEMDLPVIMMSADDSKHVVMKGVTHGACDYLIKPVRMEALKNIWQHVVRKKRHEWRDKSFEPSNSAENGERLHKPSPPDDVDLSSSPNEGNWKNSRKRKEEEEDAEDKDDTSSLKKPRVVWSVELHQQFVNAVNQLGIDKAVPKKILELMNVPGLTRENVASHLQKYRLYLRRLSGVPQHPNGLNSPFMGPPEPPYGPISSLSPIDLQALAASDQLPPQSLATIQVAALGRANNNKPAFPLPLVDQRNVFCFEGQNGNNAKKVNLLHGIPTNMDSKQLASLHQSAQSFGNMNVHVQPQTSQSGSLLTPMVQLQTQSRPPPQTLNDINSSHVSNLPSSIGQYSVSGQNHCGPSSKSPAMMDFSRTQNTDFPGNNTSFQPLMNSRTSPKLQGEVIPSYDTFSDLNRIRTQQDWRSPSIGLSSESPIFPDVRGVSNVSPSMLVRPALSSAQNNGQVRLPPFNVSAFSASEDHGNSSNTPHHVNSSVADTSLRIKAERLPDMGFQDGFFAENYGQDDLMSAILKQQEGIAASDREFSIDEYQLDNLPV